MSGRVYNEDAFECLAEIANECVNPIIVTDPPFNVGYHYRTYADKLDDGVYFESMAQMFNEYPSAVVLYPEALHRLSHEMGRMPERVVSWVYPSNTKRQHRDIGFYGVSPVFEQVRVPYRNPSDKRVRELAKRTGGARSYDWLEVNQVKNVSKEKTIHPCQMPLAVMDTIIGWLPKDATIIDPFAGSGTTCVAAQRRGMEWRAIEIDPVYCGIIEERTAGIMECEVYILSDGKCQCGNCGEVMDSVPVTCVGCGSKVASVVNEGDPDGACEVECWNADED